MFYFCYKLQNYPILTRFNTLLFALQFISLRDCYNQHFAEREKKYFKFAKSNNFINYFWDCKLKE